MENMGIKLCVHLNDNCRSYHIVSAGRENKNQYVMALLALLVARGFIKEIIVSFLMVGHTHEGDN